MFLLCSRASSLWSARRILTRHAHHFDQVSFPQVLTRTVRHGYDSQSVHGLPTGRTPASAVQRPQQPDGFARTSRPTRSPRS